MYHSPIFKHDPVRKQIKEKGAPEKSAAPNKWFDIKIPHNEAELVLLSLTPSPATLKRRYRTLT